VGGVLRIRIRLGTLPGKLDIIECGTFFFEPKEDCAKDGGWFSLSAGFVTLSDGLGEESGLISEGSDDAL